MNNTKIYMVIMEHIKTDILILGAGLAGMRASIAALEAQSDLSVTVVSRRSGPSGSSFFNVNNALGMQVCETDREHEFFVKEAVSIAAPGYIDPELVKITAEESKARFCDLAELGFNFRKDYNDNYLIQNLFQSKERILGHGGEEFKIPDHLVPLAKDRSQHGPVAYGFADTALDCFLLERLNSRGWVEIFHKEKGLFKVGLMAHAGNGGARIDKNGWTGIAGLYACGECAGGMHGANRIGGAMVLATQVFGFRAGQSAAMNAYESDYLENRKFTQLEKSTMNIQATDNQQWHQGLHWIKNGLGHYALPCNVTGKDKFVSECKERLKDAADWRYKLALETAIIICSPDI